MPTQGITFDEQIEIYNFPSQYPGCTKILGTVTFAEPDYSYDYVSNTDALVYLEYIGGLVSSQTEFQMNFPNLDTIGGAVSIYEVPGGYFNGLENLKYIGGDFHIRKVSDFTGLEQLNYIGGDFHIQDMVSSRGLEQLNYIGGDFHIQNYDYSYTLLETGDFSGLNNLSHVGGNFRVDYLENLEAFTGLEGLHHIGGDLQISGNTNLVALTGLGNIQSIGGNLEIRNNPNLSLCSVSGVCNHLINNLPANINNNLTGCNTQQQILDACQQLPVEMTALNIYLDGLSVILHWHTDTETNNAGFEVQRSQDGINWEKIGWQTGQGTTTTSHTYTQRDPNPLSGISYYRLKQVDFNGQFAYSNIVSFRYTPPAADIFPNPTKDGKFWVKSTLQGTYQIHDTAGRTIQSGNMQNNLSIDISTEAQGVYFISIQMENEIITKRMIKL